MKVSNFKPGTIFGTDGEITLVSAILKCFQAPIMLRNPKYLKDIVQDYFIKKQNLYKPTIVQSQ